MHMSMKDFLRLADYIRNTGGRCEPFTENQINHLGDFCHASNPAFRKDRWLAYIAARTVQVVVKK